METLLSSVDLHRMTLLDGPAYLSTLQVRNRLEQRRPGAHIEVRYVWPNSEKTLPTWIAALFVDEYLVVGTAASSVDELTDRLCKDICPMYTTADILRDEAQTLGWTSVIEKHRAKWKDEDPRFDEFWMLLNTEQSNRDIV